MNNDVIKKKSKEYADGLNGIMRKSTALVDFEAGALFALELLKADKPSRRKSENQWKDVRKELPPSGERVLVKNVGKFINIGIMMYDSESKKNVFLCGNSNRHWDIDFWMPLPE